MQTTALIFYLLLSCMLRSAWGASKDKPHGHKGVLTPYSGKQLPCKVNKAQEKQLDAGKSVLYNTRQGKTGTGVCIADINSPPGICMEKITDLKAYPGMVPHVKKVSIYEKSRGFDGSNKIGAEFKVGLLGMKFGYYLQLKKNPVHNTFKNRRIEGNPDGYWLGLSVGTIVGESE